MKYTHLDWQNNQPFSEQYDDIYYSSGGAMGEFEHVFFKGNDLHQRWQNNASQQKYAFTIGELGFGSGTNFILTARAWLAFLNKQILNQQALNEQPKDEIGSARLSYIAFEKNPLSPADIRTISKDFPELQMLFDEMLSVYPLPVSGVHSRLIFDGHIQLLFVFSDAQQALADENYKIDAWYMDGFTPSKNPDLWSESLCLKMADNSSSASTVATYSAAGSVKRNLQAAGFVVKKVAGHGKKREMITATLSSYGASHGSPHGMSQNEQTLNADKQFFSDRPWFSYQRLHETSDVKKQIAIIGTGIAGLSAAWSFYQRGWAVTFLDQSDEVGSGASGNPAGLVMPKLSADNSVDMEFYNTAFVLSVNCLANLQEGVQVGTHKQSSENFWHSCGCYQKIKTTRAEKIIESETFSDDYLQLVNEKDLPDFLQISADDSMIFFKHAGVVEAKKLCLLLKQKLLKVHAGKPAVKFVVSDVSSLNYDNGEWSLVNAKNEIIHRSPVVVVANGAGANDLNITKSLPLESVRGQVSEISVSEKSCVMQHAVNGEGYVTPAINGFHHIGASYHIGDNEGECRLSDQHENIEKIQALTGELFESKEGSVTGEEKLSGRVSFRMSSQDRVPVIGAMPDNAWYEEQYKDICHGRKNKLYEEAKYLPNLYVSLGHGSRGFTTAFLAAEIISALAEDAPMPVSRAVLEYIHPARFVLNQLKRRR